ncbi:conserved Plasmodium protein, unknown function [Plasmodium ovale wallikeri]|uniref:Uncharacterized protein n=2 Tax=Plasmodium ovale TaxID=36330 RepID=A0A1A8YYC3_PLAOA|nr:conserved Plasmodium protein, unknown function [Plasmodium ovale wallikeri]SBT36837.1 conserved Plasmodium protein, unknown function [Plasmodium ovale wallikeri]SBT73333.1 conserved Plasmodium protein, unknown function [Plasmodium ovale]
MNSVLFKNKNLYSKWDEKDKIINKNIIFKEKNEDIIPLENKRIVLPHCYRRRIIRNAFSDILSPIDVQFSNNILNTNLENTNKVFPLRNKKITYQESVNTKDYKDENDEIVVYENPMEPFANNNFENNIMGKTMKNKCFETKIYDTYANLENTNECSVNENLKYIDYAIGNVMKYTHLKKFQVENAPISKNSLVITNNTYTNKAQMVSCSGVIFVQFIRTVNSEVKHGNKEQLKNNKCILIEDNNIINQIKTFDNYNTKLNKKLDKYSVSFNNNESALKKKQPLSLVGAHKKVLARNSKQNNTMVNRSGQHLNVFDDVNPLNNKKIKKRGKKNIGTCFFSLNNFSCEFLMSCDKT